MDEVQQKELNKGARHKLLHFNLANGSESKNLLFTVHYSNLLNEIAVTIFLQCNAIMLFQASDLKDGCQRYPYNTGQGMCFTKKFFIETLSSLFAHFSVKITDYRHPSLYIPHIRVIFNLESTDYNLKRRSTQSPKSILAFHIYDFIDFICI